MTDIDAHEVARRLKYKFIPTWPPATCLVGGTVPMLASHPLWSLNRSVTGHTVCPSPIIVSLNLCCFSHTTDDVVHLSPFCCCWCWHPALPGLLRLFFALLYHHHDDQEAATKEHSCNGAVDGWVEGCLGQGVASRLITFACQDKTMRSNSQTQEN